MRVGLAQYGKNVIHIGLVIMLPLNTLYTVAAIRDSPVEADRRYEPNQVLEPVKGILMTQVRVYCVSCTFTQTCI